MPPTRKPKGKQQRPAPAAAPPARRGRGRPKSIVVATPEFIAANGVPEEAPPAPPTILEDIMRSMQSMQDQIATLQSNRSDAQFITQRPNGTHRQLSPASNIVTSGRNETIVIDEEVVRLPVHMRIGAKPSSRAAVEANGLSTRPSSQRAAVAVEDNLWEDVHDLRGLPPVSHELRKKLLSPSQHIDFNELLPENRSLISRARLGQQIINEENGTLSIKPLSAKTTISSFPQWSRAFAIFSAYKVASNPEMAQPLLKYLDIVAMLAEPKRRFTAAQWIAYDEQHRHYASANPDDLTIWTRRYEEAFNEISALQHDFTPAHHLPEVTQIARGSRIKCNRCGVAGHIGRDCPALPKSDQQLFRGSSAADGEICHLFNRGACRNPCPNNRRHVCIQCGADHPKQGNHDEAAPRGEHPDQYFVQKLLHILTVGADIGFRGLHHSRFVPNSFSAALHIDVLRRDVANEVKNGFSIGPFFEPPLPSFVTSSIGVVPKKSGGFRIIKDLSRPFGDSVNCGINKDEFSLKYCGIDDAVRYLLEVGRAARLAKVDIKHAFRLIPVRREDWHLLGFQIDGNYYYDVVLPFGLRSSPHLFCLFSDAILWMLERLTGSTTLLKYLDDFLFVASTDAECSKVMRTMQTLCDELGVPLASEKTEGPVNALTFLGIRLDAAAQTLSLPTGKKEEIMELLARWSTRTHCNRTELQSIIGTLQFATKCIPASRLFVRRMIRLLSSPSTSANPTYHLDSSFQADINWWQEFLPKWNGTASFLEPDWSEPDVLQLYTDASGLLGLGAYHAGEWFQSRWPASVLRSSPCIELLEMIPVLLATLVWSHKFRGRRILFHCDNMGVVDAWKNLRSQNPAVLGIMRRIVAVAASNNFAVNIQHIRGTSNDIADALSRFQTSRFRRLAPNAEPTPVVFPNIFKELSEEWDRETG